MRGDLTRLLNRLKVFWHCLQNLAFKCLLDNTRCFSIVLWATLLLVWNNKSFASMSIINVVSQDNEISIDLRLPDPKQAHSDGFLAGAILTQARIGQFRCFDMHCLLCLSVYGFGLKTLSRFANMMNYDAEYQFNRFSSCFKVLLRSSKFLRSCRGLVHQSIMLEETTIRKY